VATSRPAATPAIASPGSPPSLGCATGRCRRRWVQAGCGWRHARSGRQRSGGGVVAGAAGGAGLADLTAYLKARQLAQRWSLKSSGCKPSFGWPQVAGGGAGPGWGCDPDRRSDRIGCRVSDGPQRCRGTVWLAAFLPGSQVRPGARRENTQVKAFAPGRGLVLVAGRCSPGCSAARLVIGFR
jgi:hypothetical protein